MRRQSERAALDTSDRALNAFLRAQGMAQARRETFADDTSTGRLGRLRRPRRAIIAASVEGRDFDWWLAFLRQHFPGREGEVKSENVLGVVGVNPAAREQLLRGLAQAGTSIVIIDFSEFTASMVRSLYEAARMKLDGDPLEILEQGRLGPALTESVIRCGQLEGLESSTVSRVEWLYREALGAAPIIIDEPNVLVDRNAYDKLDTKAKEVFLAHFSVVFGEALDPRRQANLITKELREYRFFSTGSFAYRRLEDALIADRVVDEGASHAVALLRDAHEKMPATLEEAYYNQLKQRAGTVKEEDSRVTLGLAVADVAAGVAAVEYERAPGDVRQRAAHIREIFDRVLLNDEWL